MILKMVTQTQIENIAFNISKQTKYSYSHIFQELMSFSRYGFSNAIQIENDFLKKEIFNDLKIEKLHK